MRAEWFKAYNPWWTTLQQGSSSALKYRSDFGLGWRPIHIEAMDARKFVVYGAYMSVEVVRLFRAVYPKNI